MKKIVVWLKAAVTRLTGANEAPSLEIDIMEELNRIDEENEDLENFKFEL